MTSWCPARAAPATASLRPWTSPRNPGRPRSVRHRCGRDTIRRSLTGVLVKDPSVRRHQGDEQHDREACDYQGSEHRPRVPTPGRAVTRYGVRSSQPPHLRNPEPGLREKIPDADQRRVGGRKSEPPNGPKPRSSVSRRRSVTVILEKDRARRTVPYPLSKPSTWPELNVDGRPPNTRLSADRRLAVMARESGPGRVG
jgi:hypothetical protein